MLGSKSIRITTIRFDLRFKIQASIIVIVFISLLVVALSTILYNVKEYQKRHKHDLDEKMKSISEEIDMRLYNMNQVDGTTQEWMYRELAKLSNVFSTDINIYGNDGNLLATSREEIYQRDLISTKINSQAYFELYQNYKVNYFQPEQIGKLSYLSGYEPIIQHKWAIPGSDQPALFHQAGQIQPGDFNLYCGIYQPVCIFVPGKYHCSSVYFKPNYQALDIDT